MHFSLLNLFLTFLVFILVVRGSLSLSRCVLQLMNGPLGFDFLSSFPWEVSFLVFVVSKIPLFVSGSYPTLIVDVTQIMCLNFVILTLGVT